MRYQRTLMFPTFFFHSELLICHELKPCYTVNSGHFTGAPAVWMEAPTLCQLASQETEFIGPQSPLKSPSIPQSSPESLKNPQNPSKALKSTQSPSEFLKVLQNYSTYVIITQSPLESLKVVQSH